MEDTEHWRQELSRIAEMVGLVTSEELAEIDVKKEPVKLQRTASSVTRSPGKSPLKSAAGEYSERTGRWNETPRALSRSRSLNRRTPLSAIVPTHLFCVDEQEREMWVRIYRFSFQSLIDELDLFSSDASSTLSNLTNG